MSICRTDGLPESDPCILLGAPQKPTRHQACQSKPEYKGQRQNHKILQIPFPDQQYNLLHFLVCGDLDTRAHVCKQNVSLYSCTSPKCVHRIVRNRLDGNEEYVQSFGAV